MNFQDIHNKCSINITTVYKNKENRNLCTINDNKTELIEHDLLTSSQFGFRKGKSAIQEIIKLVTEILQILIKQLFYGIGGNELSLIKYYNTDRTDDSRLWI